MSDEHLSDAELEEIALAEGGVDPWDGYDPGAAANVLPTQEFMEDLQDMVAQQTPELGEMSAGLTTDQIAVAESLSGPIVVVAGPGAGKTKTLVERTVNAIRNGATPESILIVTFTRKAANEVRERLTLALGEMRSRLMTVTTFHGFSGRLLRTEGHRIDISPTYDVLSSSEQKTLVKQLVKQYNMPTDQSYLDLFSSVKRNPDLADTAARKRDLVAREHPEAAELFPAYEAEKKRLGRLDYDDMIMNAYRLLQIPEVLARWGQKYRHVMVDEYQDTDRMQHGIVRAVASGAQSVMVVGDTDQAIYEWRGGSPLIFTSFSDDFPGTQVMYLNDNFRSTPEILEVIRHTVEPNKVPYRSELRANNPAGAVPRIAVAQDQNAEAELVADWIMDLLGKETPFSEIAVLYRGRRQNLQLQSVLSRAKIPVKVSGGVGFYERKTVKDLLAWFRLAVKPDEMAFRRVIEQVPGVGPKAAQDLIDAAGDEHDGDIVSYLESFVADMIAIKKGQQKKVLAVQSVVEKIEGLRKVLDAEGIAPSLTYAMSCIPGETLVKDEISEFDLDEIRGVLEADAIAFVPDEPLPVDGANEVYHYRYGPGIMLDPDETTGDVTVLYVSMADSHPGLTYPATAEDAEGVSTVPVASQVLALDGQSPLPPPLEFLQQVSLDNQALAEAAGGAIELSTIHAAKGREWDNVAIIGLVDGKFPMGFNTEGGLLEPSEEERRVMFVAESRARRNLLLTAYRSMRLRDGGYMPQSPSKFLYELEEGDVCALSRPLPKVRSNRSNMWGGRPGVW